MRERGQLKSSFSKIILSWNPLSLISDDVIMGEFKKMETNEEQNHRDQGEGDDSRIRELNSHEPFSYPWPRMKKLRIQVGEGGTNLDD